MCDPILVTLLKMRPHYSQSSCENATPSSGASPLASYREVPPPLPRGCWIPTLSRFLPFLRFFPVFFKTNIPKFQLDQEWFTKNHLLSVLNASTVEVCSK